MYIFVSALVSLIVKHAQLTCFELLISCTFSWIQSGHRHQRLIQEGVAFLKPANAPFSLPSPPLQKYLNTHIQLEEIMKSCRPSSLGWD